MTLLRHLFPVFGVIVLYKSSDLEAHNVCIDSEEVQTIETLREKDPIERENCDSNLNTIGISSRGYFAIGIEVLAMVINAIHFGHFTTILVGREHEANWLT